jgi:Mrp family chromosome partitioning ATPase
MKVLIVYSGKGGVGKSTTSHNLFKAALEQGHKTAILDADVNTPSLHKLVSNENKAFLYTPHTLFKESEFLPKAIVKEYLSSAVTEIKSKDYDYLIIDTPPSITDVHYNLFSLLGASMCLIVTQPRDLSRQECCFLMKSAL